MRVILVDDERKILRDLEDTVGQIEGLEVVGAYVSPLAALEDICNTKPNCAFLDIEMPGMTGIDLAERLLEWDPGMDIVFITAFNHYATQAFEVNAMDYVLKPVHPDRFEKTVRRLLKKREASDAPSCEAVRLRSLGCFEVLFDGNPLKWSRSKSKELMAYLLHFEGCKKSKFSICADLWPDYEPKKALAHLQTAMCSLRKSIAAVKREDMRVEFLGESYVLHLGNVTWDVRDFKKHCEAAQNNGGIDAVKNALSLYQGDYMDGEDWNWACLSAQSLALKYETLLKSLAEQSFKNGSFHDTTEAILKLAQRQPVEIRLQLLLAEAAYAEGGKAGLAQQMGLLRSILKKAQDTDLEPEVLQYCMQKGLQIS
ncbi:MAG TPA: response regulator [Clostridia bacterium]|nr:response regulator [Clostridia bacterium]